MKRTFTLIASLLLLGVAGTRASVSVTGTNFNLAVGSEEALLLTDDVGVLISSSWAVGSFPIGTNFQGSATGLMSAFDQNGSEGSFHGVFPGAFGSEIGDAATSLSSGTDPFKGTPIYLVIFDGASFLSSTDLIVFRSSALWPEEVEFVGGAATVDANDADLLRGTPTVVQGATGAFAQFNGTMSGITFVPEPSAGVLLSLASLGLFRRRRATSSFL